jgi:hypothetical protein
MQISQAEKSEETYLPDQGLPGIRLETLQTARSNLVEEYEAFQGTIAYYSNEIERDNLAISNDEIFLDQRVLEENLSIEDLEIEDFNTITSLNIDEVSKMQTMQSQPTNQRLLERTADFHQAIAMADYGMNLVAAAPHEYGIDSLYEKYVAQNALREARAILDDIRAILGYDLPISAP